MRAVGSTAPARLVAYGHSWVQGDGASDPSLRMVDLAAKALGLRRCNLGVGGSSTIETAALVREQPPPPARLYVLLAGLNDLRLHGGTAEGLTRYADALRTVVAACRSSAPDAVVVAVQQPHLLDYSLYPPHDKGSDDAVDRYNAVLRRVAGESVSRLGTVVVAAVAEWDAATMLADDTVHPNDLGHAALARTVVDTVVAYGPTSAGASTMASTRPVQD
jgi:lysophospholipase L1-like esterase